ncbi:MAG TPA: flagellar hook-basal body protein [Fimbriimonadales bacterium]|nr:flagellar hook-basal body protein [Fimbriimonadales bacterium]
MNRGIQAAANGMQANQLLLDVLANNLANLDTVAFKRDGVLFAEMLEREMFIPDSFGEHAIGRLGSSVNVLGTYTSQSVGPAVITGNPLDVMLEKSNQFFAIETPDGIRYTRDGEFRPNNEGYLATRDGYPVLDASGRAILLPQGAEKIEIAKNGAIIVDGAEIATLDVREGNLTKVGKNLYVGEPFVTENPIVSSGVLEGSNVSAIECMVEMISLLRNFEAANRAVRTQDELTERLLQSLATR